MARGRQVAAGDAGVCDPGGGGGCAYTGGGGPGVMRAGGQTGSMIVMLMLLCNSIVSWEGGGSRLPLWRLCAILLRRRRY